MDFPSITELLLATGYDGWVMIELDQAPAIEIDAVKTNLAYMTQQAGPASGLSPPDRRADEERLAGLRCDGRLRRVGLSRHAVS